MRSLDQQSDRPDEWPELNAPTSDDVQAELDLLSHGDGAMRRFEAHDGDGSADSQSEAHRAPKEMSWQRYTDSATG